MQVVDLATKKEIAVPSFMTYIDEIFALTTPSEDDLGEYRIKTCSIVQGEEYCAKFNVNVEPCQVKTLTFDSISASMEYTVGEESVTGGAYTLIQYPDCGLPIIITENSAPMI